MPPQCEEIFNNIHQFTGLLDPDGILIKANDTALEFGGVTRPEVIGSPLWETCWFRVSKETQRQVRDDVQRAAAGEFVRHSITVQGADQTTDIDFSIQPLTDEDNEVRKLLPEGRDIATRGLAESRGHQVDDDWPASSLLVAYSRDADELMTEALLHAFLAINVDVFDKRDALQDLIDTDLLDGHEWGSEYPLAISTRLWGHPVVMTAEEVRIYTDPSQSD